jgi:hypothetical protein
VSQARTGESETDAASRGEAPGRTRWLALSLAVALIGASGCGSDESGQENTAPQVSVPPVTSPIPTGTAANPAQGGQAKPKKPPPTGGSSAGCTIPVTYQNFQFAGVDCASAVAVADAWDASPDKCNTIDNPDSPLGYNRTCELEGYTCDTKRDVRSDGRFVTCTQGGVSIRFTWFPS